MQSNYIYVSYFTLTINGGFAGNYPTHAAAKKAAKQLNATNYFINHHGYLKLKKQEAQQ